MTIEEIKKLIQSDESDRIERTISINNTDKFSEAICAFANDLPKNGKPGYLLIGVKDDGTLSGLKVTDMLLKNLGSLRDSAIHKTSKIMYMQNIEIINTYSELNKENWRPTQKIKFESISSSNYIMKIEEINIKMKPSIVYTFNLSGKDQIGGLWFVSQKDGFSKVELGMFCDVLNRYLNVNYSDRYVINNSYCTVVDVMKGNYINYQELEDGKVYEAFIPTIREIKSLM